MGDRTSVTLCFPTELLSEVESISGHEPIEKCDLDDLTFFDYRDINYGDLQFLNDLRERGIPYDQTWESGSNFEPGTEYCRFTPEGEIVIKNIYDSHINPDMDMLLELIDDHVSLKNYILKHKKQTTPLPWDDQVKYGKIYRTRQLINA